jgi:aspartate aminotransferase-like enzyme
LPNGSFGERFVSLATKFGADVVPLKFEWGRAVDPDTVRKALLADPKIKAVIATHNETSTGVTNDLAAISAVVKGAGKLFILDAISSAGSLNLPVDVWQIDVTITCSQKGFMAPPGLAMVAVSPEAWQANASARLPRFYWDFARAKKSIENNETPWTPAVPAFFALDVSLDMIFEEGLSNVYARHAKVAQAARDGVKSLGLSLFADEKYASNTVTAVNVSNGLDVKKMLRMLREEHGVVLSGGQSLLDGKIFRIGHLGWVDMADIGGVVDALKVVLPQCGFKNA